MLRGSKKIIIKPSPVNTRPIPIYNNKIRASTLDNESITFPSNDTVIFHLGENGDAAASLDSIVLVGEFTTEDGPYTEDHLLSVWLNDQRTFEIPVGSPGVAALLDKLGAKAGLPIKTSLATKSSFASRVLYPLEKSGQELFVFESARKGLMGVFYKNIMERRLTPSLISLIEAKSL